MNNTYSIKESPRKRIGVITYYHYNNYGTMLQALALQCAIEMAGADCDVIDCIHYEDKYSTLDLIANRIRRIGFYLTNFDKVWKKTIYKEHEARKNKYFDLFAKQYFNLSQKHFDNYKEVLRSNVDEDYDILMTGSDQTFSPKIGLNPVKFLDFVKDDTKRVAYAPSLGVTSLTDSEKKIISRYLKHYKYLSCRETMGTKLLQELTETKVETVLDPTLLLTKENWRSFANPCFIEKPFILCYFIGDRMYYRRYVEELQRQTGYDIYYIPVSYKDFNGKPNLLWETGPAEFLGLIDKAEIVCTDSFHGMCFSINFQKDFYGFTKVKGGIDAGDNSRIYDLLNRMGLVSRFKTPSDKVDYTHIDYDNTRLKGLITNERDFSWAYLKRIIQ